MWSMIQRSSRLAPVDARRVERLGLSRWPGRSDSSRHVAKVTVQSAGHQLKSPSGCSSSS
jgi:hypothetical protein